MAVDLTALFGAIESHQAASGWFERVARHEPKAAPGPGLTAASWLQEVAPVQRRSGLDATSARVELVTRIYRSMLAEPQDAIDPEVYGAVDHLIGLYSGDFELGGVVAEVDLLGAYGAPLMARAGYLNQDRQLYRVMDVTTPLIVNDVWAQSP